MSEYLLFASIWFASAITPGADGMLLLSRALVGGWRATFPYAAGITIAKVVLLSLAYLGLTAVLTQFPGSFVVLKIFGASFLVWRAFKIWNAPNPQLPVANEGFWPGLVASFAVGVSNPQAILFYIAIVPQVSEATSLWILNLIVFIGFTLISTIYVLLAKPIRLWLGRNGNQHRLNKGIAIAFLAIASFILFL